MKELPNECIHSILINFAEDNKSLFSCCLINRLWCLNTVPVLWKNPSQSKASKSFIRTCLSTLSPEEKEPLTSIGITLSDLPKPLFEYGAFLKTLDTSSIKNGIHMWLNHECLIEHYNDKDLWTSLKTLDFSSIKNGIYTWLNPKGLIERYDEDLWTAYKMIMDSLIIMFLRRSENLEKLLITDQHMLPLVTTFLNSIPGTTQLKSLWIFHFYEEDCKDFTSLIELMNALIPKLCPYLKRLSIKSYLPKHENDTLKNIIKSHKNLEKIELDNSHRNVVVYDISSLSSEKTVKDFFSFCGKVHKFKLIKNEINNKQTAYITFERESAARTALMLTNAVIGDSQVTVKPSDYIIKLNFSRYFENPLRTFYYEI
ncbi:RNA-binding protein vip1 [Gigaspora margarita]|uniref:RNA-binding protein vip1 n=1 Tax=Gigaspora margarita TaxID=4874 RepID=A0A8H3XDS3_GIGMA|nr:RNA-binding protein vip1 [Gigaspora margarita]